MTRDFKGISNVVRSVGICTSAIEWRFESAMILLTKSKGVERRKISSIFNMLQTSEVCQPTAILNFGRNQAARHGSCLHEPITYSNFTRELLLSFCAIFLLGINFVHAQSSTRKEISLNANWLTIADEKSSNTFNGFQVAAYNTQNWKKVNVPHNWDQYEGYQRKLHGILSYPGRHTNDA